MRLTLTLLSLVAASAAMAQQSETQKTDIVVTGNRAIQAEITGDLAKSITLRPPVDQPLPKYYDPVCVKIFGMDPEFAEVLAERITSNLNTLKLLVGNKGCQPNSWVGFVPDSQEAVAKLRKDEPAMFAELHPYEIDRIFAGAKAAQAWHALEAKGVDGKPFRYATIEINGVERTVKVNSQWQAGRTISTIRVDMIGAIVLFDSKLSAGHTIRQLADYATFRLLAPVRDTSAAGPDEPQSILSLFSEGGPPPSGLTEFDWAYLSAFYKLSEGAGSAKIHDAAKRAFLDGTGQKLAEKSDSEVPK